MKVHQTLKQTRENDADVVLLADFGDVASFASDQEFVELRFGAQLLVMTGQNQLNSNLKQIWASQRSKA